MGRIHPASWRVLREAARDVGFADLGAVAAADLAAARAATRPSDPAGTGLREWLRAGHHGTMDWMARRAEVREDPRRWWASARTVLVGLLPYDAPGEPGDADTRRDGSRGRISRYAWGRDYHLVAASMLRRLGRRLEEEVPGASWRALVDHGPAMEKPLAVLAGLGWIGKHGNLLRTAGSSWFFIALLVTDADVSPSEPFASEHCGTCRACIDACPTDAILEGAVVDARRCISYLTIELRDAAAPELRARQQDWVFGCDVCQDVCPWNRHRTREGHERFRPGPLGRGPRLEGLLTLDDASFREATPKSAVKRARREGLVRSAAIAAGNSGDTSLVRHLAGLLSDPAPSVRRHAAWAIGRLGGRHARASLEARRGDPDGAVREEIAAALDDLS